MSTGEMSAAVLKALTSAYEKRGPVNTYISHPEIDREVLRGAIECITALTAEVERLKGDFDRAQARYAKLLADDVKHVAQLERLRAAAEPFAKAALAFPRDGEVVRIEIVVETPSKDYPNYYINTMDLWRAQDALTQPDAKDEG